MPCLHADLAGAARDGLLFTWLDDAGPIAPLRDLSGGEACGVSGAPFKRAGDHGAPLVDR